jgi:tetratricopeptide (TPR) repeat protein
MELGEGHQQTAQAAFDRALELDPDSVEAVFGACEIRLWLGHAAEALAFLDAHPQGPRAHTAFERLRADLLERLDRAPEAEAVRQGLAPPQDAIECYLAGRMETFAGEHGDQAAFARAFDWSFRANLLAPAPRLLYQLDLAHLCHHVGDSRNGHRIAGVLQQRWPDSAPAWCWSGFAMNDDLPAAIAAYQRAIDLKPDYGLALLNLGSDLERAGRTDEAIAICRRAIAARRWDPGAEFNLGVALDKKGRREEATAAYRRALVLQPDHPQAHANLAAELYQDGDYAGALAHYDQAVQTKPDYDVAWMMRGGVLAQQGDLAESITSIRKALELRPDYLLAHVNLARVLQASGDAASARQQVEQALVLFRSKPQPDTHAIAMLQKALRELDTAPAAAGKAR